MQISYMVHERSGHESTLFPCRQERKKESSCLGPSRQSPGRRGRAAHSRGSARHNEGTFAAAAGLGAGAAPPKMDSRKDGFGARALARAAFLIFSSSDTSLSSWTNLAFVTIGMRPGSGESAMPPLLLRRALCESQVQREAPSPASHSLALSNEKRKELRTLAAFLRCLVFSRGGPHRRRYWLAALPRRRRVGAGRTQQARAARHWSSPRAQRPNRRAQERHGATVAACSTERRQARRREREPSKQAGTHRTNHASERQPSRPHGRRTRVAVQPIRRIHDRVRADLLRRLRRARDGFARRRREFIRTD